MRMSRRARRMERHHKRSRSVVALSLVSLMDIFTILVFFLLVHSSDVETLPTKAVRLPESIAEKSPKQTVVVTVNNDDILVQGQKVTSVTEAMSADGDVIASLKSELEHHASRRLVSAQAEKPGQPRAITIMADKEIPYRLLKKIMVTCVRASYENISLAVLKREIQS